MFLHELSRSISSAWEVRVDGEEYETLVREYFGNKCPYCGRDLTFSEAVIEHLDGMNRLRGGLHVPGNVLVACARCNSEKRRDDSLRALGLAESGWESFLSHDGQRCGASCRTCAYWSDRWPDPQQRSSVLAENRERIRMFRKRFAVTDAAVSAAVAELPRALVVLYTECQAFAETEIKTLLEKFRQAEAPQS
ncbi:MAG: HNH endonuclease [Terracidiphilus sp.]